MGIEIVRFASPAVHSALLERTLQILDLLAHGLVAAAIGVGLLAWGFARRDARLERTGLAVLLAVAAGGLLANLLKLAIQHPRPGHGLETYAFPSGHATTAFAVAAVLARAFPSAGPVFSVMALFAGLARVYYRDHFLIDVVGGALLGAACGLAAARWQLGPSAAARPRAFRVAWAVATLVSLPSLAWVAVYEHELDRHIVRQPLAAEPRPAGSAIQFGTDSARRLLGKGWSGDERWEGRVPFVWAEGLESTLHIPPLPQLDHRARLRVIPFVRGQGLSCQVVEVNLNGKPVGRLVLDRGWNQYEMKIPGRLIQSGPNEMGFRFAYAGRPAGGKDPRLLSVAFGSLELLADRSGR